MENRNLAGLCGFLKLILFIYVPTILLISGSEDNFKKTIIEIPKLEKIKNEVTRFGDTRVDNYNWLREKNNPKVIEYLKSENDYLIKMMENASSLQTIIFDEITKKLDKIEISNLIKKNGYYYYIRYQPGEEYSIYCRRKSKINSHEEILLNENKMAKNYKYFKIYKSFSISPNNRYIAFAIDKIGDESYTIFIKDLVENKMLPDEIPDTAAVGCTWANDNRTLFYSKKEKNSMPKSILKHHLGEDILKDKEVYCEQDDKFMAVPFKSPSDKYIFILSYNISTREFHYIDADNPDGPTKLFAQREKGLIYYIQHVGNSFYILCNDHANNFKIMVTSLHETAKENWKEFIPPRNDVFIDSFLTFKDFLVLVEKKINSPNTEFHFINLKNQAESFLNFGNQAYYVDLCYLSNSDVDFNANTLYYFYSSPVIPDSIFSYNIDTKKKKLLKQQKIEDNYNPSKYNVDQLFASANDGKKVPITLIYKKGILRNGNNPTLMYGYGCYGINTEPYFNYNRFSLINRGFIIALAHVRGGQELGPQWHEEGKLLKKRNTFTDFISCAEYLINEKYTNPQKLFAYGSSAGGLLVGAVINMRPDLFKGVVALNPSVDVLNTMLDESIQGVKYHYEELGNPKEKLFYDYLKSYSPYENIEKKDYPAIFTTGALNDSRVSYWEPAKWVAKLREMKTDNNLILFKTNLEEGGHFGASGRYQSAMDIALGYTFILKLLEKK